MGPMVEVADLTYAYPGSIEAAVKGIDFSIHRGEILGFLGPSGAGKSTTQKILIGLLKGFAGKARVDDRDIAVLGPEYYEGIGVSFELPNLFSKLSGRENLRFFASLYAGPTEEPKKLLELVGLNDKADVMAGDYSKGMKMRLNFARSLINRPKVLFLDEPTSGLDPANAKRIKEIIKEKKKEGTTIFLTTHNMAAAEELCDRVAFIVDGEIKVIDAPRELKIRYGTKVVKVEYRENGAAGIKEFPFDGIGENRAFIGLLRKEKIETIHSQEATLEDIFIRLTGRELTTCENGDGE